MSEGLAAVLPLPVAAVDPATASRSQLGAYLRGRYVAGAGIRELAAELGRSYGYVRPLLLESGVILRPRGGSKPKRRT